MLAAQEFLFDLNPQLLFDAALLAIAVFFLYMLMSYLLFNPARKLLKDRQDHISSELDEASADKEKAAALKAEYEAKLKEIDKEAETILADARQKALKNQNRIVNEAIPITDARLENGDRVNIVLPPVAVNGPIITIRRFPKEPITMERLIELGSVSKEVADFLKQLVCAGYNIFICGGTGSGKTTFLNALSDYIPKDERIITIEDNAELQIQGVENLVRLEARKENTEGKHAVTIRDLIKSSLRMRPSRIIVGEVRGDEVVDMLQAMNTGMDGSLSTGHGNSPSDMLVRLETMVLMGLEMPLSAVRRQIASGIDILIHLGRLRDKSRRVLEIREITGYDYESGEIVTSVLYEFLEDGKQKEGRVVGKLHKKEELFHVQKLIRAGIVCQVHGRLT